jgi:hypothetical protein
MIASQPLSRLRAIALSAALFAITLAVLQPLAHAVMLRVGGLEAAAALWGPLCKPDAGTGEEGERGSGKAHECCFGLAHAPALGQPSSVSIAIEAIDAAGPVPGFEHHPSTGAIRDGPHQPRAPPLPEA